MNKESGTNAESDDAQLVSTSSLDFWPETEEPAMNDYTEQPLFL